MQIFHESILKEKAQTYNRYTPFPLCPHSNACTLHCVAEKNCGIPYSLSYSIQATDIFLVSVLCFKSFETPLGEKLLQWC